jgi:hypothetical protein
MPRSLGTAVENNFTGGLVTEATALNFPENAVTYTENCVFDKTGYVTRRGGLNLEPGNVNYPESSGGKACSTFLWRAVSGNGSIVFVVVQVGRYLHFYKSVNAALSQGKASYVHDLYGSATEAATGNRLDTTEAQFAMGNGNLFVVHPLCNPFYIVYDQFNDSFQPFPIDIQTRDFGGVPDGLKVTDRPGVLSGQHYYNLLNQGWVSDTVNLFKLGVGGYPANSDVWWLLKDSNGNFKPGPIESQVAQKDKLVTVYGDIRANSIYRGNTPAPRGHFTLSPFFKDLSFSGVFGLPVVSSGGIRPSCVAFFTGRTFYSGVNSPDYTDKIYFTQILEKTDQYGKCYQENDPTSETSFNLLPSDGGVISIPEAGIIYKLFPIAGTLVVFAANGIWAVTGSTGIGFSASDYTVSKVSSINVASASSFVDVEGYPAFWNDDGIYMVTPGQTGNIQVSSMTEKKIKTFFKDIPLASKLKARGFYNPTEKTVQWLYSSTDNADKYNFDSALIFNTMIEAFYPWSFVLPGGVAAAGLVATFGLSSRTSQAVVTSQNGQVVTSSVGNVTTSETADVPVSFEYKYLVFQNGNMSFGELNSEYFYDWTDQPFVSEFITGYKLRGEGSRNSQVNYLQVYFTSGYGQQFKVQSLWDYANDRNSNRWSVEQVVYGGRGYKDYDFRKLKIRGHGRAVQYRFSSMEGKPFKVQGWVSTDSVNSAP